MAKLGKTKKFFKFTFVSVPLGVLGIHQLRRGNKAMQQMVQSISNPSCPNCEKGVLILDKDAEGFINNDDSEAYYPWICSQCEYKIFAPVNIQKAKEIVKKQKTSFVTEKIQTISDSELEEYSKTHKISSRIFFSFSILTFLGFFYMLSFSNAKIMTCMNYLFISIAFGIYGLVRSYRYWQLTNKKLYIDNSFKNWIKNEKWFV